MKSPSVGSFAPIYFSCGGPSSYYNRLPMTRLREHFIGAESAARVQPLPRHFPSGITALRGGSDKKEQETKKQEDNASKDFQRDAWIRQSIYKKDSQHRDHRNNKDKNK